MIFALRLCRYATTAAVLFTASLYSGVATAQNPAMTVMSFGGNDLESLAGFAIDGEGNYYIAGTTASLDLPVNVLQKNPGGAFLYRFRAGRADPLYPPASVPVSAIASDPSRTGHLYAAFARGVWKSFDSGDTWQRLEADWPANADCTQVAVAPKDGRTVYVLCSGNAYPDYAPQYLFRSTDAGVNWTRIRIERQQLLNLAVDPFNPRSVWAAGSVTSGWQWTWFYGFHSSDGGETWTRTDPNLLQFAFDDRRPGVAYAAVGPADHPGVFPFEGFYQTQDSGQSWTKLAIPSQPAGLSGASIAVLPSGDALFLIGNLLQRTRDSGITWQSYRVPDHGRPCQDLYRGPDSALRADPRTGSVYLEMCGSPQSVIYRSDDAGATWVRVNRTGLPQLKGHALSPATTGSDYFVIVRKSFDAFVAKLSPAGGMLWSTFLGGVHDETATGLALDSENRVYLIGTTLSEDFRFTAAPFAKALPDGSAGAKSFIAKLSPDGTQLQYSALWAYDATARGITVDVSGAVYITGNAGPLLPTTPGTIRPYAVGSGPNPFVLKLDPSGTRVAYGTYLAEDSYTYVSGLFPNYPMKASILANAVAVDSDGNAYVGGTYIWKLNPDATGLVFSTKLDGGAVNAVAVDANRNLYVGGAANTASFFTTANAFQHRVLPTACGLALYLGGPAECWATPAFVTKYKADASLILYSTYLGGDGGDATRSLAIGADGTAYAAGPTTSRSFPTRLPIQGRLSRQNGFVTALVPDGADIAMSTYVGDGRPLEPVAVALDPAGNPVLAGHHIGPSGYGGNDVPTPASGILIFRLDYSQADNVRPRLDAILNAASRTGTPLAPGQRVTLRGAGFPPDSRVCFKDECISPIAVTDDEMLATPPASLPDHGSVTVSVRLSNGRRSNEVTMPAGPAQLALYSADNSGTGPALALNADGTLNSPSHPARRGTVVTIPANGIDTTSKIALGPFGGFINASISTGTFPGIPGDVPLIHVTVDPGLRSGVTALPLLGYTTPGHMPVTLFVDSGQPEQGR